MLDERKKGNVPLSSNSICRKLFALSIARFSSSHYPLAFPPLLTKSFQPFDILFPASRAARQHAAIKQIKYLFNVYWRARRVLVPLNITSAFSFSSGITSRSARSIIRRRSSSWRWTGRKFRRGVGKLLAGAGRAAGRRLGRAEPRRFGGESRVRWRFDQVGRMVGARARGCGRGRR